MAEYCEVFLPQGPPSKTLRLGVSRCLLGQPVRYDGGHKLDRFLTSVLEPFVEFIPICPEAECGLGVPREAMRLVGDPENPRLVTQKTGRDLTRVMQTWAEQRLDKLDHEGISGFIFKSKSPSSGMSRVKVYREDGKPPARNGVGIFARMVMARYPYLPVEDEGRLNDMPLRENFIERIFVFKRLQELQGTGRNPGALVEFHTRHKLMLMAHSPKHYTELGRLVAKAGELPFDELFCRYATQLMQALALLATTKKNVNVLQHLAGYFKQELSKDEKAELQELIERYAQGLLPLIVPITLIRHYVRKYRQPYLEGQFYLEPHPVELMLRNHV